MLARDSIATLYPTTQSCALGEGEQLPVLSEFPGDFRKAALGGGQV